MRLTKFLVQKTNKFALIVFVVIFGLSLAALGKSIVLGDFMKIGLSFVALILYFVPLFVNQILRIQMPILLEIVYYLFIFASLILGEVFAFYGPFPFWDVILHFLSGFIFTGVGFSLVQILTKNKEAKILAMLFSFCFSITIGTLWECIEFTFDMAVQTDAQKDAHISQIATITLQRDGGNQPVLVEDIIGTDLHLKNGEIATIDKGYLDIGLIDTMKDLLVNLLGSILFLIPATFYLKQGSKATHFINSFILVKKQK